MFTLIYLFTYACNWKVYTEIVATPTVLIRVQTSEYGSA